MRDTEPPDGILPVAEVGEMMVRMYPQFQY